MEEAVKQFYLEEYKALRAQLHDLADESRVTRYQALIGTVAVYAWLSANGSSSIALIGWLVPLLFPIFGFSRYYGNKTRTADIAAYIRVIESKLLGDAEGWENFLQTKRQAQVNEIRGMDLGHLSAYSFWIVLFAVDFLVVAFNLPAYLR